MIAYIADGIPYAVPKVALLYRATNARRKGDDDFASVLPLLDPAGRRWLAEAIALVHPRHRWLDTLSG